VLGSDDAHDTCGFAEEDRQEFLAVPAGESMVGKCRPGITRSFCPIEISGTVEMCLGLNQCIRLTAARS